MSDYIVAVTGGVASGKSAVTEHLARLGVAVADADVVAREMVQPGQPALREIAARFGADMLDAAGGLDRAAMRRRVFADPGERRALEAILHPRIRTRLQALCAAADSPYAVVAVPLLVEGGGRSAYPWLDRIVVVDVPEDLQVARLMARDGIDEALARKMLAAQASREARLAIADEVVDNSGDPAALQDAVVALHRRLLGAAATHREGAAGAR